MARYQLGAQLPPIHFRDDRHSPNNPSQAGLFGSYGSLKYSDNPHAGAVQKEMEHNLPHVMLQDHIQTVTMAVTKITKEIEVIEEQLRNRTQASEHTNNSVKSLEIQHVGSVSDLRQRVGRCDVSIAKLSGDSRRLNNSLVALNKQIVENNAHHAREVAGLERKIIRVENELAKYTTEQNSKVDIVGSETKQSMAHLDTTTKIHFEELQRALNTMRMKGDSDRQLLERGLSTMIELAVSKRDITQGHFEKKILDRLEDLEKNLVKIEGSIVGQSDKLQTMVDDKMKRLELQIHQEQESLEKELKRNIDDMEQQHDDGFKRVKDSMATMRTVLEGKQQLLADNLHKQFSNVKKLVVLT